MLESPRPALVRTTLITYGVAGLTWLLSRSGLEPQGLGGIASTQTLFTIGLVAQVVLVLSRYAIRNKVTDPDIAAQTLSIVELIGDGVTVLVFALGTFGALLHFPAQI